MIGDTPVQLVLKIRYQANDAGISLEQQDQIFRVAHRQRPEQQHVHNCENQSGGADPDGHGRNDANVTAKFLRSRLMA